jgi:hypothetical protein
MIGNLLWWFGWPIPHVMAWWGGFLVLTIVGERLELTRLQRPSRWGKGLFFPASGIYLLGLFLSLFSMSAGVCLSGLGLAVLALWLTVFDIARRTVRLEGLPRFTAICLLSGYAWLAFSGLLMLFGSPLNGGFLYDAAVHALFLGFVVTMIFGHAPIIFPAVMSLPIPFRRAFYLHLILLHGSILLRVASDLSAWMPGRQWGGLLNGIAVGVFLVNTVGSLARGLLERRVVPVRQSGTD